MKIIFFGTPDFAAFILSKLIKQKKEILAAVTLPDRKKEEAKKSSLLRLKKLVKNIISKFLKH